MSDFLNEIADGVLNYLLTASVVAAVLPVLACVGIRLGRVRAAVYRHTVWLYCLIGIALLPPLWLYGPKVTLAVLPAKVRAVEGPARPAELHPAIIRPGDLSPGVAPQVEAPGARSMLAPVPAGHVPQQSAPEVQPAAPAAATKRASFPMKLLLAGLWLAGFAFMLTRLCVGWRRLRRICRSAKRVTEIDYLTEIDRRKAAVLVSSRVDSPVCFGILRPTVILPEDIYDTGGRPQMQMVLSHELAHVERWDYLTNIFQRLLEAAFFFHPMVWYASRQVTNEREQVCDNWVLARGAAASDYAKLLSSLAERGLERLRLQGVALFEGGLFRRIRSLLDQRRIRLTKSPRITAVCLGIVAVISFGAFGVLRLAERDPYREEVAELEKAYRLSRGQDLKFIGPPLLRASDQVTFFEWDGTLRRTSILFGKMDIRVILRQLAGIYPQEVEGDEELMEGKQHGDFIIRKGVPPEKAVGLLQVIFQQHLKLPVKMTFREVPREVIVARGAYRFTPVPGRSGRWIEVYGANLEKEGSGGGGGDLAKFLKWAGMYLNRQVINEVEAPPKGELHWNWHFRQEGRKQSDLVLQHLAEQTGLTFTKETRRVRVLFVERAESKTEKESTGPEELPARPGAWIEGVVVDEESKPVEGAMVNVVGRGKVPGGARTAADGTFILNIEKPTLWYVTALATANEGARQGLYEFKTTQDSTTPSPIRIMLKPSLILSVHVTDAKERPVSEASVEVLASHEPVAHGKTDGKGLATVRVPEGAEVEWIVALKSGVGFDYFENYKSWLQPLPLPKQVKLVLDGARQVRIRALDSANKPVPNIGFTAGLIEKNDKISYANLYASEVAIVRTNARGIAVFDWLPAKNIDEVIAFGIHEEGYHCPQQPELLPSGHDIELTARLLRNTRISGKVFLPEGKPADGILIQAEGRGDTNNYYRGWARTAADGFYVMTDIFPNQSYIVAVIDDAWAAPSYTGIVMGENRPRDDLDFHLAQGTLIHGQVTSGPQRKPVGETTATLVQQGAEVPKEFRKTDYAHDRENLVRWTRTDNQGRYALRVGSGKYTLSVGGPRQETYKKVELTVEAEEEIVQDFRLGVDVLAKPLTMKFKATDGRNVDLAELRGKIVLVHFWAASDDRCAMEISDLKRSYEKYHEKGFEIVGISFDTNKDTLQRAIEEKKILWPQYFEGRGPDNAFAREFTVSEIPTMWLIGKDGNVVDMDVNAYALAMKVRKLLGGLPLTGREPFTLFEDLSDAEKNAVTEFEKAYSLSEGQDLRYMGPPFLPCRDVYFRYKDTFQWEVTPDGPDNWYFRWSDGLKGSGMSFGRSGIRSVLKSIANIYPQEVEGDEELLNAGIRGDFIVREGVALEKSVRDLQDILQRDLKLPVKMTFREVPREVIVARGAYRFTPVPGRPAGQIEIYGEKLEDPYTGGGGSGDFNDFLNWVGMYVNQRVINGVSSPPESEVKWHDNHQREGSRQSDLVLQHLAEQTGLTFTKETRRVRVLFVERAE